jgi:hypothetical protein
MAPRQHGSIRIGDYEILTDANNWILRTWHTVKPKGDHPLKAKEHCRDRYYPNLQAMGEKIADLEVRKLVETVGADLEGLGKALGEKLTALEDEIRAEWEWAQGKRAA